jgi:hypothetical protein
VGHALQPGFGREVVAQPGGQHGARGQAGDAGEFDHVLIARLGQHTLELDIGVALQRDGEGRTQLHGRCAQGLHARDVLEAADAAGRDQGHLALKTRGAQEGQCLRNDVLEIETGVLQVGDLRRTQVPAGQARMLDHDGIGHALLAFPLAHHELHATRVGQDGHQQGLRVVAGQVGQVERQTRANHHRVDAALEGPRHGMAVFADRAHHVDGEQAAIAGECTRRADFARQRLEVGFIDGPLGGCRRRSAGGQFAGLFHQVGIEAPQVDRRDRAHRPQRGHAAGQAVRRDADAHAALNDGQEAAATQRQGREAARSGPVDEVAGRDACPVGCGRRCQGGCGTAHEGSFRTATRLKIQT